MPVSWEEKFSSWAPTFHQELAMPIYVLPVTISSWLRNIQVNTGTGETGVSGETSSRLRVELGKRSCSINSVEPGYLRVKAQNQRLPLSPQSQGRDHQSTISNMGGVILLSPKAQTCYSNQLKEWKIACRYGIKPCLRRSVELRRLVLVNVIRQSQGL